MSTQNINILLWKMILQYLHTFDLIFIGANKFPDYTCWDHSHQDLTLHGHLSSVCSY